MDLAKLHSKHKVTGLWAQKCSSSWNIHNVDNLQQTNNFTANLTETIRTRDEGGDGGEALGGLLTSNQHTGRSLQVGNGRTLRQELGVTQHLLGGIK